MLTVETEVNEVKRSMYLEMDPSLVGSFWVVVPVQEIFVLPWLL
jgi:hypothetical protein